MIPLISPKGVAELQILRQKLSRYQPGEIAHIENVMLSEIRTSNHRRLRRSETEETQDKQRESESTRDLQTTERFELEREVSSVAQSQESFQAGISATGSFGPVSVTAHADYSSSSSREDTKRAATKYAKETVDKALNRIKEVVEEKRTTRLLEEVEEVDTHTFDNSKGTDHISGIYRWVDKFFLNKVFSYGRRLMYEFYVPEPARFYQYAVARGQSAPPKPPDLPQVYDVDTGEMRLMGPQDVDAFNYMHLVGKYGAIDVKPPPPATKVITKPIARMIEGDSDAAPRWALTEELEVPEGYGASEVQIAVMARAVGGYYGDPVLISVAGLNEDEFLSVFGNTGPLALMLESRVPISIVNVRGQYAAMNIVVTANRLGETLDAWRLDAYQAIMTAYNKMLAEYQDVVSARTNQNVQIAGTNPEINTKAIAFELKRSCIAMWLGTGEVASLAVDYDATSDEPSIDVATAAANTPMIRFLEQSFDWDNMTYELLPYYYGSHDQWSTALTTSDADPMFQEFLRAGAARVVVPVWEDASQQAVASVLYYQKTGTLWPGADPPTFDGTDPEDEYYHHILADLADQTTLIDPSRDTDFSADDPDAWEVKIPTTLVWLELGSALPGGD